MRSYNCIIRARGHTALDQKKWHGDPRLAIVLANAIGRDRQGDVPSGNLGGIVMTCVRVLARLKACLRRSQFGRNCLFTGADHTIAFASTAMEKDELCTYRTRCDSIPFTQ